MLFASAASAAATPNLSATVVQNSSVYDAAELFGIYQRYMGQPVTDQTATNIAEALRERYAADGFARPGYKVLDTGERSGIVRIRIVELMISGVDFSGSAGPYEHKVQELANALPSESATRLEDIQNVLRRVRRLPGLSVTADTYPDSGQTGRVILGLNSDYQPLEASLKLSNRGTREIGRNLAFARAVGNGLFGLENSVGLYAGTSEDSDKYKSGGVFGAATFGSHRTAARLLAGVSALRLDAHPGTQKHDRKLLKLRVTQPLWQESSRTLSVWGEFALEDLDIEQAGFVLRVDRLRSLAIGSALRWGTRDTQYYTSVELEQGLIGLGSELNDIGNPDDPRRADFTIARIHVIRLAKLQESWSLRWDAYGQYSSQVLPSTKQFKVGGNRIGRGFEAAAIRGDRGIGNKVALKRQLDGFADWRRHTAVYGFYDLGTTWLEQVDGRESAASAGIGISFGVDWFSGQVELAKPLTHTDEDGNKDAKIFAEIEMQF